MNKQKLELACRAVACDQWRWMEGMRGQDRVGRWFRVTGGADGSRTFTVSYELRLDIQLTRKAPSSMDRCMPDLSDPATLGCLLHLVREAWDDPLVWVERTNRFYAYDDRGTGCCDRAWVVHINTPPHLTRIPADTEIEALIAALEAAMETEVEQ